MAAPTTTETAPGAGVVRRLPSAVAPEVGGSAVARLAGALVVATVLAVDPWGFAPFGPLRWLAVGGLALVGAAVAVRSGVVVPRLLATGWLGLLAVLAVATLRAPDPVTALLGTADRRLGWASWLVLGAACLTGLGLGRSADRRALGRAAAGAGLALGVYALVERFGAAPVDVAFADGRLGGPFGQPAYLGAAALLCGPVAVGLGFDRTGPRGWRVLGGIGAAGSGLALVGSGTRGAWFGLAVAAVVMLVRRWPRLSATRLGRGGTVALVVAVLVTVLALPGVTSRLAAVADADGTAAGRLAEWGVAVRALAAAPGLGYGPEGYRTVFGAHAPADYYERFGTDVFVDRAHHAVLDVGLAGGVLALIAYGGLLVGAVVVAGRAAGRRDPVLAGLAAAVLAYVGQLLFLFPTLELDPVFWSFVGVLTTAVAPSRAWRPNRLPASWWVVPAGLAVVWLGLGAADVAADRRLADATGARGPFGQPQALAAADEATRLRLDSTRAWFVAARVAREGGTIADLDLALERLERGLEYLPHDPVLRQEHAWGLLERAQRSQQSRDARRAVAALDQLHDANPNDPRVRSARVEAQRLLERLEES